MKDGGTAICAAQEKTAEVITEAGAWVGIGGAGGMFADIVNMSLELFCTVLDAGLSAPAAVGDLVGVPRPGGPVVEGEDG